MSSNFAKWNKTYKKLREAIHKKDPSAPEMISREVAKGYPVNYTNKYGLSLLHHAAARFNSPDCRQTLIELGTDPNLRTLDGRTAFYIACDWGNIDCAKALIDAGVDWSIPHENGTLPLDKIVVGDPQKRADLEAYIKAHLKKQKETRMDVEISPEAEIEISW